MLRCQRNFMLFWLRIYVVLRFNFHGFWEKIKMVSDFGRCWHGNTARKLVSDRWHYRKQLDHSHVSLNQNHCQSQLLHWNNWFENMRWLTTKSLIGKSFLVCWFDAALLIWDNIWHYRWVRQQLTSRHVKSSWGLSVHHEHGTCQIWSGMFKHHFLRKV